ncbi:MAG: TnsA endonuclease N-terminal domain-containing protein [Candidatus Dojkabacteria bacterium]|nr:TnsA endonuclease N-terminal domain-containing protein [Candidatus Dojkabacteria bacterium]
MKKKYWGIYNKNLELVKIFKDTEETAKIIFEQIKPQGYIVKEIIQQISKKYPKIKIYKPKQNGKYKGKNLPIARSSWEYEFMKFLDSNPYVVEWFSEGIKIPYINPFRTVEEKRPIVWYYYPDFFVKLQKDGKTWCEIIEIKPYKQTIQPIKHKYKTQKLFENEMKTYILNQEKWKAAYNFCKSKGWIFKVITEKDLFSHE